MNIFAIVIGIILLGGLSVFAVINTIGIIKDIKKKRKRKLEGNVVQTIEGKELDTEKHD